MINCISKRFLIFTVLFAACFPFFHISAAQPGLPASTKEVVDFSAKLEPLTIRNLEKFRLVIEIDLKPGWHIYSVIPQEEEDAPRPTMVFLEPGLFVPDGPVYETRPSREYIDVLKFTIYYHQDHAELYQNLEFERNLQAGEYNSSVKLEYQLCTDVICLPIESRLQKS